LSELPDELGLGLAMTLQLAPSQCSITVWWTTPPPPLEMLELLPKE
jgi:hypothetical protein